MPYCINLIMVTITRHVFIDIFQMEQFSVVKKCHGLWEKYKFSSDTKISRSFEKKKNLEKNQTGLP